MLQFLEPIWLYTATAVALPLLIHLWNLRKGKRRKIGSLLLITQSIQPTARQLRLTEWLLLLLRCLLILLLALLLAKPSWQNTTGSKKEQGWVMIPRESIGDIYPAFKTKIDSLMRQGFEIHAFNFPFEKISVPAANKEDQKQVSYWKRLAQLNDRLPAGFPVILFSEGRMDLFTGARPGIALDLQWHLLPSSSRNRSLVNATALGQDSLVLKFRQSDATKNIFTTEHVGVNASLPGLKLLQTDSGRFVQQENDSPVRIDTNRLRVTVYQSAAQQDANYLNAALEAIRPMLDQPLQVTQAKDTAAIPPNQDWIFWLSDEPIKNIQPGANYLAYAAGAPVVTNSVMIPDKVTTAAPASLELHQRINNNTNGETRWKDGFGQPVLSKTNQNIYRFYTRFNPSWTNIVWNPAFPELIFGLIQQDRPFAKTDLRQIDTTQLSFTAERTASTTRIADRTELSTICWFLLLLCLAAERWLSLNPKTRTRAA